MYITEFNFIEFILLHIKDYIQKDNEIHKWHLASDQLLW